MAAVPCGPKSFRSQCLERLAAASCLSCCLSPCPFQWVRALVVLGRGATRCSQGEFLLIQLRTDGLPCPLCVFASVHEVIGPNEGCCLSRYVLSVSKSLFSFCLMCLGNASPSDFKDLLSWDQFEVNPSPLPPPPPVP